MFSYPEIVNFVSQIVEDGTAVRQRYIVLVLVKDGLPAGADVGTEDDEDHAEDDDEKNDRTPAKLHRVLLHDELTRVILRDLLCCMLVVHSGHCLFLSIVCVVV